MKPRYVGLVGLCGLLLGLSTPASAGAESTVLLRSGSFGSYTGRPIRHYSPHRYERETPYGFFTVGGGIFDPVQQPSGGFYGVISGGSEVGQALDIGVQLSWHHRSSNGEAFGSSYVGPGGAIIKSSVQTQSVDTDLLPLMGIVRLKFPTPGFQPYVGGGAGYEWLFIQGVDATGFEFSNDYGGFGAQAMGGVNLIASPTVALYGEAVYNWTDVQADFFDPVLGLVVHESVNYDGWGYHGGLRFRF